MIIENEALDMASERVVELVYKWAPTLGGECAWSMCG